MEAIYLWPDRPALSLLALRAISSVALWAGRDPMFQLIERLGKGLEEVFEAGGRACKGAAEALIERSRTLILAAGGLALQTKQEKDFHRIEVGFSERLGQYSGLHRQLEELLQRFEADYQQSGESPPAVPGWTAAVEAIAGIPNANDPNVQEILEGVRKSLDESQRQALHAYRADTAERHEILDRMRSLWKEVRGLLEGVDVSVSGALDTAARINTYIDEYARVRNDDRAAARTLTYSTAKVFAVALLLLAAALAGTFVSFELLAKPLTKLVPEAHLWGLSVATLAAFALVGLELALGVVAMDGYGLTELFPMLARLPAPRRRWIFGAATGGLVCLALVEGWLVEPALLGSALAFLVALIALPLELLLDSGRPVSVYGIGLLVSGVGSLCFALGRATHTFAGVLPSLYDVYVSIPLRIERALRTSDAKPKARQEVTT